MARKHRAFVPAIEEPKPRRGGFVAWASAPPDLGAHTFNDPKSNRVCGEGDVQVREMQRSAWSPGANTYAQAEQYREMNRRKGVEEDE